MTDKFLDRVADLAGRTTRVLDDIADVIEDSDSGLESQAATLRRVADEHRKVALDCLVETQPISTRKVALGKYLRDLAEDVRQVAAELMERGIGGHDEVSEAADQLDVAAAMADQALAE